MIVVGPAEIAMMKEFLLELNEKVNKEKSEDFRQGYAEGATDLCKLIKERWKMHDEFLLQSLAGIFTDQEGENNDSIKRRDV